MLKRRKQRLILPTNDKNLKYPLDFLSACAIIQKLSDSIIKFGGIAQLGERLNGIQEVSGSIPLISTKTPKNESFSVFFFSKSSRFPEFD